MTLYSFQTDCWYLVLTSPVHLSVPSFPNTLLNTLCWSHYSGSIIENTQLSYTRSIAKAPLLAHFTITSLWWGRTSQQPPTTALGDLRRVDFLVERMLDSRHNTFTRFLYMEDKHECSCPPPPFLPAYWQRFHPGAHLTGGLDIRPIRVVAVWGAGRGASLCFDSVRSGDRGRLVSRRCVPDSGFVLPFMKRVALDTLCGRNGRSNVSLVSWGVVSCCIDARGMASRSWMVGSTSGCLGFPIGVFRFFGLAFMTLAWPRTVEGKDALDLRLRTPRAEVLQPALERTVWSLLPSSWGGVR